MIDPLSHFYNAVSLIWEHLPDEYVSFTILWFIFVALVVFIRFVRSL